MNVFCVLLKDVYGKETAPRLGIISIRPITLSEDGVGYHAKCNKYMNIANMPIMFHIDLTLNLTALLADGRATPAEEFSPVVVVEADVV